MCVCVCVCTVSGDLNLGIYISRNMIVCMCRVARNVYNAVSMLVFDLYRTTHHLDIGNLGVQNFQTAKELGPPCIYYLAEVFTAPLQGHTFKNMIMLCILNVWDSNFGYSEMHAGLSNKFPSMLIGSLTISRYW